LDAHVRSRTDLIEGSDHLADIDREIAEHLSRRGSWSKSRMRDMVDATIFRRDPDLVRNTREDAKKSRGVWGSNADHGMAVMDAPLPPNPVTGIGPPRFSTATFGSATSTACGPGASTKPGAPTSITPCD